MLKTVLLSLLALVVVLGAVGFAYTKLPKFGPSVSDIRSPAVLASPNYIDGAFRNLEPTRVLTTDVSFLGMVWQNMRAEKPRDVRPAAPLPSVKTDLKALAPDEDLVVWLGHSSYYVQIDGLRVLIDPVFSRYAAPVPFVNEAFPDTNPYTADDMPAIDVLLITHEHWDHLDYDSVAALLPKVRQAVVPLGLKAYLTSWGYALDAVRERDWNDHVALSDGVTLHILPARHYTHRLFATDQTLWAAFALISDDQRLFFSGDSGYGKHFADIGARLGPFTLAAIDAGQYNDNWAEIHMTPDEAAQAAVDLRAEALIPAHVGKFALARHSWKEPFNRIVRVGDAAPFRLLTPEIGTPLTLTALPTGPTDWWD